MVDQARIEAAVREILVAIGEDPERDGLVKTPGRVARMYAEVFAGIGADAHEPLATHFEIDHDELVLVRDIRFHSMCEHHLLPFFGVAHVGYIPSGGTVTGLSKLARVVDLLARRPQVQEHLTTEIADALNQRLHDDALAARDPHAQATPTITAARGPNSWRRPSASTRMRSVWASVLGRWPITTTVAPPRFRAAIARVRASSPSTSRLAFGSSSTTSRGSP